MKILVDTSVWSQALRRPQKTVINDPVVRHLNELINQLQVSIIGPIRQELLSGISSPQQFEQLRSHLAAFPDINLSTAVYELAAQYFTLCRHQGVQGSHIDFLICATSVYYNLPIFTLDQDFTQFEKILPVQLYHPPQIER